MIHRDALATETAIREWNNTHNPSQNYLIDNPNEVSTAAEMALCELLDLDWERERFRGRHDKQPWQFVINGVRVKVYAAANRYQRGHLAPEVKQAMADIFAMMWVDVPLVRFAGWLPFERVQQFPVRQLRSDGRPSYCVPWQMLDHDLGGLRVALGLDFRQGTLF